jgi:hypothetical protein
MLKLSLAINSSDEARLAITRVRDALEKSNLSQPSKHYLSDAVCATLALWENQLSHPTTKSFKADRLFSGDDYRMSTPEEKCIDFPEQKYISEAGKKGR